MKFPEIGGGQGGGKNAGLFVKLKDGERVMGVFRGDPSIFRQHWVDGRSSLCIGKAEGCERCAAGEKPKFRFRLNFLTKEDGIWIAKIFEGNYGTYKDLKEIHENNYSLPETLVTVSRSGEKQNTRYVIMPVKNNGNLKAADFQKLDKIPLNELSESPSTEAEAEEGDANEDVPF